MRYGKVVGGICIAFGLLTPSPAGATTHGCPTVSDEHGDVTQFGPFVKVQDDQLDIRGADIAANRTAFAVEIRLYGTALTQPDPLSPSGRLYTVVADVGTGQGSNGPWIGFYMMRNAAGQLEDFAAATFTDPAAQPMNNVKMVDAHQKVDEKSGKIRMWVDYKDFDRSLVSVRPGRRVRHLWAMTAVWSDAGQAVEADSAERGGTTYRFGERGCIPVGS